MAPTQRSEEGKELAGIAAADSVESGMALGLGSGSTVACFLRALARRIQAGELEGILGVPTSLQTEKSCRELGIPLTTLEETPVLDLAVDGADEVDPELNLIKGLGGALLREKMIAQASRRLVIIVDEGKMVDRLGTRSPLPVEVVRFGWGSHFPFLEGLGGRPVLRKGDRGEPFLTDNGNHLIHCCFPEGIPDPYALDRTLVGRAGVVDHGLFLDLAQEVLVGGSPDVRRVFREG